MSGAGDGDLARAAWPEVDTGEDEAGPEAAGPLVLVPVGSTEQHGPHLPLSTDTVIARAVAERAARVLRAETSGQVLVAPAIAYGASGEHAGFPGTVSIGHEALHAVIVETARSLALWAGRVVFVNGHGGNVATLDDAVARLRQEGHDAAWAGCDVPGGDSPGGDSPGGDSPGGDAHAGLTETSVMLYLAPGQVRPFHAVTGETRPLAAIMPELIARGVRAVSPSGVLGDPAGATAERGRRIVAAVVASVVLRIRRGRVDDRGRLLGASPPGARA